MARRRSGVQVPSAPQNQMSVVTIYRKDGAVRFTADALRGVIFVSFALPLEERRRKEEERRKYKWENKVTIALDPTEASIIGAFARMVLIGNTPKKNPVIRHTPEKFGKKGPEKVLRIEREENGIFFQIEVKDEKISVGPIGFADLYMIDSFLTRYIPEILPKPKIPVQDSEMKEQEIEQETEEEIPGKGEEEDIAF